MHTHTCTCKLDGQAFLLSNKLACSWSHVRGQTRSRSTLFSVFAMWHLPFMYVVYTILSCVSVEYNFNCWNFDGLSTRLTNEETSVKALSIGQRIRMVNLWMGNSTFYRGQRTQFSKPLIKLINFQPLLMIKSYRLLRLQPQKPTRSWDQGVVQR